MARVALLGPQRFDPTVSSALGDLAVRGPLAVITAGWQEREAEDDELRSHVGCELTNLELYKRFEDVLVRDPDLAAALRERQERLKELQALYRLRLAHALESARELMARPGNGTFLAEHRRAAVRALRTLDRQHLTRVRRLHREFEERWQPTGRPAVARHRRQFAQVLSGVGALAIAGGHVAVLINRLRLFDPLSLIGERPVVAWSAGAMALTERVVLFHDSPPQGRGDPEVLDSGLGVCRGLVALPHARRRLRLDDPVRVALFARRFSPATSVVLEGKGRLEWADGAWRALPGTLRLTRGGRLRQMGRS
jgi:hypothetical protein